MTKNPSTLAAFILLAACTSSGPASPDAPERVCGQQYAIFFSFGKSAITDEADEALRAYVELIREFGPTRIKLTGHCDTAEPEPGAVSKARVDVVAQRIKALGVTAEIQTRSVGSNELLVQTPAEVKEPQNRRVTIDY